MQGRVHASHKQLHTPQVPYKLPICISIVSIPPNFGHLLETPQLTLHGRLQQLSSTQKEAVQRTVCAATRTQERTQVKSANEKCVNWQSSASQNMQNIQEFLSVNTHLYKNNEATMP
jgi:hypothetical protein